MRDPDIQLIATDDADAARLQSALNAVTPSVATGTTDSFNEAVRRELGPSSAPRRHEFRRRVIGMSALAAAAAVLLAVAFPPLIGPRPALASWADVVKAVSKVEAVHVASYWEKSDRNLGEGGITRDDTYYRRPKMWRGQGWGYVQFLSPAGERLYDVRTRKFVDPKSALIKPLNVEELKRFKPEGPLLDAVLDMLFNGKAPQPVPVPMGAHGLAGDLDLYEYRAPAEPTALTRIWVAKSSRLPVRIDMLNLKDDSTISCHLEYGNPLPEAFFDANRFAATVEREQPARPEDIFRVGFPPNRPAEQP